MESNEPAFILATSGTTAKPKLAVHTHGGYQVYIHSMGKWVFGLKPDDVWWSTSDIGWVVGHSYIVYAPLIAGCTTLAFEGALDYPGPERSGGSSRNSGHRSFHVADCRSLAHEIRRRTAAQRDHSSLERSVLRRRGAEPAGLGVAAEEDPAGPRAGDRPHVADGDGRSGFRQSVRISRCCRSNPVRPTFRCRGSRRSGLAGGDAVRAQTKRASWSSKRPFPGLTPALWGEPERYGSDYWHRSPDVYYTGDSAHIDDDGYVWFAGRADEIIKIAGHRIGTIEVETAFLKHPAVAEAGVIGPPRRVAGRSHRGFRRALKQGTSRSRGAQAGAAGHGTARTGPVAVIGEINFVGMLPKTRSGKIMRRVLRAVTLDREPGDVTTIEDEGSVDEARHAWHELKSDMN